SGRTKSCGCLNDEQRRNQHHARKHGASFHPLFPTWSQMMLRCSRETHPFYRRCGGRGIKVCKGWRDFWTFFADMGKRPTRRHQLERVNNDGDYKPSNCRWATRKEQARNRRNNRRVTYKGVTRLLVEWEELTGIGE